jgi:hypothetical protein
MIADEDLSVDLPKDVPCVKLSTECINVMTNTEAEDFRELQGSNCT